jgi:hypothetical protein
MTKVEQLKLVLEGKAVLNEMLDRQANGDNTFDDQIATLKQEWGQLVRDLVEEA